VAVILTTSVETQARALPRTPLALLPTPLVPAPRLAAALGTGLLLVKRDDLTGFAFGGNKARLLEFLVAAAAGGERTLCSPAERRARTSAPPPRPRPAAPGSAASW
jgi:hypothetical protein